MSRSRAVVVAVVVIGVDSVEPQSGDSFGVCLFSSVYGQTLAWE